MEKVDMEFEDFFTNFGLESIKDKFLENEFTTILALTEVSDEDLKEIGVKAMGKRKQFLAAIRQIKECKSERSKEGKNFHRSLAINASNHYYIIHMYKLRGFASAA